MDKACGHCERVQHSDSGMRGSNGEFGGRDDEVFELTEDHTVYALQAWIQVRALGACLNWDHAG